MKKVLSLAFVGAMALTVFGIKTSTSQAATTVDSTHVSVVAGDTYKSIAEENGVSISALEQANGREVGGFDIIYPGETITLPTSTAVQQNVETTQTQAQPATQTTQAATTQSASTQSAGTFKISFYDPAVLGSNMGYSGVAANLSVFPKGTQLKITLSDGTVLYRTVNDTGTFAYSNPQQLDVAMPNSSIPSYGVTSASVEVVG
ncbi:DPBB and LysM peptidoglycan-binding domain-containing protein [Companilactobacillus sp.]|jgi:LysM repeat protein|uniref:DPBB and LysM peptidoglycan-binding domain-containing protein n=1 Tax=Companilactobacillus sp. TaxID=2767905 RepID=UPI0025BB9B66|nr:LysM peptidoglycan-binding domain-containing protein [Companilactobacillus sp.]MCH4008700.1 LysM peptidoglycan-binding domain-containing protein [Companilactobacillus sp.]MCH4051121.1 LysM peptidoglycan-binding domain-containing protein [Companilactobacillus sp.]MCH4076643.1 LysM peptidoglycan-binding domain-containing protein [Companilactobacillus sp.]MCH4125218.1 LysM peptidoglycan-binding domain-containing protein [Companilactobacillus sp.]MCH4131758.1 LysM peptidoglycan-binding domain-c